MYNNNLLTLVKQNKTKQNKTKKQTNKQTDKKSNTHTHTPPTHTHTHTHTRISPKLSFTTFLHPHVTDFLLTKK